MRHKVKEIESRLEFRMKLNKLYKTYQLLLINYALPNSEKYKKYVITVSHAKTIEIHESWFNLRAYLMKTKGPNFDSFE